MDTLISCKQLFTRFGLLWVTLPYFSNDYIEWCSTIRPLWRKSDETWSEHEDAIKTLFRFYFHKVMRYARDFNQHFVKFVLMYYKSMYYSLEVNLNWTNSYKTFIEFLDTMKSEKIKLSFYAVNWRNIQNNIEEYNEIWEYFKQSNSLKSIKSSDIDFVKADKNNEKNSLLFILEQIWTHYFICLIRMKNKRIQKKVNSKYVKNKLLVSIDYKNVVSFIFGYLIQK